MEEDDFLWQCAMFEKGSNSISDFMVPGILDEPKLFLHGDRYSGLNEFSILTRSRIEESLLNLEISLSVVEIRGNGVLDTVGGEIWEACLLLCAYILLSPDLFVNGSVLELGSGLGLPGLLVAELQSLVSSPFKREVCLSDNDPRCVESLVQLIERSHGAFEVEDEAVLRESSYENKLSVVDMDWSNYVDATHHHHDNHHDNDDVIGDVKDSGTSKVGSTLKGPDCYEQIGVKDDLLNRERFQVLMGSALCYSPYHICLADTIKHFLDGACEEVIVIQISDRAGYSLLLNRLTLFEIVYTVEEVSEAIYENAQLIGQTQFMAIPTPSSASSFATSSATPCARSVSASRADEGEVRIEKRFVFPSALVQSAVTSCRAVYPTLYPTHSCCAVAEDVVNEIPLKAVLKDAVSTVTITDRLIKTDKESFKILRARKVRVAVEVNKDIFR